MKIAVLGARGIPARYSGYDTLVEELSLRLARIKGIDVLVYCRKNYYKERPKLFKGISLIYLPAPRLKAFESLFHSFLSMFHVLMQKVDVIYFLDPANAPFCLLLRIFGKKVVLHTDGLGWKRRKWGRFARIYYKFVELLSARVANALVTDNLIMKEYYLKKYNAHSFYISYGASNNYGFNDIVFEEFNISYKRYLLVVARLEPENNTDLIIKEYVESEVIIPLVIVGDSPYSPLYLEKLIQLSNERVIFTGRIYDQSKLNSLYRGAYLYIHGHEVGGTNPSLLRAMGARTAPIVIDIPFNKSVIGSCGFTFNRGKNSLSKKIQLLISDEEQVNKIAHIAKKMVDTQFTWESVANEHKKMFFKI